MQLIEGKKTNLRKKDVIAFAERFHVSKKAAESMLNDLANKVPAWIEKYDEIGFEKKKTNYLKEQSYKRLKMIG